MQRALEKYEMDNTPRILNPIMKVFGIIIS